MVICQQTDLHHENSGREAKSICSFGHGQRSSIFPKNPSEGLGVTFKDYKHYMSMQVTQMHVTQVTQSEAHSVNTTRSEALSFAVLTDRNYTLQMC